MANISNMSSITTGDARCTSAVKSSSAMEKAAFKRKKKKHFTRKSNLYLRKRLVKFYTWSISFYCAENWTLRKLDQKYLRNFEIWRWRR
jgi:hypothetical protein